MASAKKDPMLGKVLGNDYTITRLIAKGGMGRVYEATDSQLGRQVAVKVIMLDEEVADELMQRFEREARVIGQLDHHPNIVTIYRYGKEKGVHFIAMKLIKGISLGDHMDSLRDENRFMEFTDMLHTLRQVAAALDYAHAHGVIHRDIKPANIMLEDNTTQPDAGTTAILMDFGLVLHQDKNATAGTAFGTPRYISPEQAIASTGATPQSDIYSLGVVVYELLTGRTPFDDEETPVGIALSHVTKEPPSPKTFRDDLPDGVVPVLMKVLAKKPEERYKSASEFVGALSKTLVGEAAGTAVAVAPPRQPAVRKKGKKPAKKVDADLQKDTDTLILVAKKSGFLKWVFLIALVILLLGGGYFLLGGILGGGDDDGVALTDSGELELYFSGDGILTLRNPTSRPLWLEDMELREGGRVFSLRDFGVSRLRNWLPGMCSYVALLKTDYELVDPCTRTDMNPPILYASSADFVWMESRFDVYQDGKRLGTCQPAELTCVIEGVQQPSDL